MSYSISNDYELKKTAQYMGFYIWSINNKYCMLQLGTNRRVFMHLPLKEACTHANIFFRDLDADKAIYDDWFPSTDTNKGA